MLPFVIHVHCSFFNTPLIKQGGVKGVVIDVMVVDAMVRHCRIGHSSLKLSYVEISEICNAHKKKSCHLCISNKREDVRAERQDRARKTRQRER